MIPEAREVRLRRADRKVLEARCRSPVTLQRDLKRAQIVLLAAEGRSTRSIAKAVGVQLRIVSLWRHRYAEQGLEGLEDKPRPGKKPIYTKATDRRILALLDKPPPEGFARSGGRTLVRAAAEHQEEPRGNAHQQGFLREPGRHLIVTLAGASARHPTPAPRHRCARAVPVRSFARPQDTPRGNSHRGLPRVAGTRLARRAIGGTVHALCKRRRTMACAITSLFLFAMFGIVVAAGMAFWPSTKEKPSARRQETPVAPSGDRVIA